ncbi:MAG: protoporphyrinogen oxidase [Microthrixaceae bacterium]|nr:protoporphyrinogen oxidase [Microthrixaceae bacterium]
MERHRVAVVGGGITGLVAARRLSTQGHAVTVFEAGARLGGQIRTETFVGHDVDTGAEALHLAGPHLPALLDELGLTPHLVPARPGRAQIWDGRRLRSLPSGVGPTGPTRLGPVLRSRILSPAGLARAGMEPLITRSTVAGDQSVGDFLDRRFGPQVVDRFVDPLLGNLHGGDVRRLSLEAVAPYLAQQSATHRSLVLAGRSRRRTSAPTFWNFPDGLVTLVETLSGAIVDTGGAVRVRSPIEAIGPVLEPATDPAPGSVRYRLPGVDGEWDAVVLAVPPAAVGSLLVPLIGGVGVDPVTTTPVASVATVVVSFRHCDVDHISAFDATGLLVPSRVGAILKAATFLTRKWQHLDRGDRFLVRMSAGRARDDRISALDDDALLSALVTDLASATGLKVPPVDALVRRWPESMTQLEVGHLERIAELRRSLTRWPGVVVAGSGIDGLGVVACTTSGERAAAEVARVLSGATASVPK